MDFFTTLLTLGGSQLLGDRLTRHAGLDLRRLFRSISLDQAAEQLAPA